MIDRILAVEVRARIRVGAIESLYPGSYDIFGLHTYELVAIIAEAREIPLAQPLPEAFDPRSGKPGLSAGPRTIPMQPPTAARLRLAAHDDPRAVSRWFLARLKAE